MISSIVRIKSDMNDILKNPLDSDGVFPIFDENDIFHVKALIIGSRKTPYEGGFFVFDIRFPNDYPMKPPAVLFELVDNGVRFNPNLYRDGKVCLSIINTWSGPQWTPCNTLRTVLLSISVMVFNDYPLRNEPGHQDDSIEVLERYNSFVQYQTMNVGVFKTLNYYSTLTHVNDINKQLFDIMCRHFSANEADYDAIIQTNLQKHDGKLIDTEYGMRAILNYSGLSKYFKELHEMFVLPKYSEMKVEELRKLASERNISVKVKKDGKMKYKTKKELVDDLS